MSRFAGLEAIVTGGARGIGAAVVERLRSEGAQVRIADILDGSCDVTNESQVSAYFASLEKLDILICAAGLPWTMTAETASLADWRACISLNLESVWLCTRAAVPLLKRSDSAAIVTIPSNQAIRPNRTSFPYSVAKGGLISLTKSLAIELAPRIRVNGVIPGQVESVRTGESFATFRDPAEAERRTIQSFPLRRLGKPEDIANAVVFLASTEASWITGSCLFVDGGRDAAGLDLSDLK